MEAIKANMDTPRDTRSVRGHIDIPGNELADNKAAEFSEKRDRTETVTGEGFKAWVTKKRKEEENQEGWGNKIWTWPPPTPERIHVV